jgi:hypothetical protein
MDDPSRLIDCMSNNQDKKQLSLRKIPRTSAPKLEHTIKGVYKNKAATPLRTKTITMAQVAKNGERRAGSVPEATPRKVLYRFLPKKNAKKNLIVHSTLVATV